jgi:hypothetical protein
LNPAASERDIGPCLIFPSREPRDPELDVLVRREDDVAAARLEIGGQLERTRPKTGRTDAERERLVDRKRSEVEDSVFLRDARAFREEFGERAICGGRAVHDPSPVHGHLRRIYDAQDDRASRWCGNRHLEDQHGDE